MLRVNIHRLDRRGRNAAHAAAEAGEYRCLRLLHALGCDVGLRSKGAVIVRPADYIEDVEYDGCGCVTPEQLAEATDNDSCVELLRSCEKADRLANTLEALLIDGDVRVLEAMQATDRVGKDREHEDAAVTGDVTHAAAAHSLLEQAQNKVLLVEFGFKFTRSLRALAEFEDPDAVDW
jgi:hypothetical protein